MQVALISPVQNLDLTRDGDIHMVLAHLVKRNPQYADFYLREKKYKLIDCGACEGETQSIETCVEMAERVRADELILPDIIFQGRATVESAKKALDWLDRNRVLGKIKIHAVPQGSTREEWWTCFNELNDISEIDVLGISKLSTPVAFKKQLTEARVEITTQLYNENYGDQKQIHLLGGSYDVLNEVRRHPDFIRSIDTSAPFEYARHQKFLSEAMFECPKAQLEIELPTEGITPLCIKRNIKALLEAAHVNKS